MKKLDPTLPKAPSHLSTEAKRWWRQPQGEYDLSDKAARLLLQTALEAFDRMREAQRQLDEDGPVVVDRFGQRKAHPATVTERDARSAMLTALNKLNLDIEPLNDGPGRPMGS